MFDPPVTFTLRFEDAYAIEPFDAPIENKRDFSFVYPNMAGCLEAEFLNVPLTTVRNYRGGFESGLNHYGGVVYALSSRTDIKGIEDLKDKVVTACQISNCVSISGGCLRMRGCLLWPIPSRCGSVQMVKIR